MTIARALQKGSRSCIHEPKGFKNWSAQSTYRRHLFSMWPRHGHRTLYLLSISFPNVWRDDRVFQLWRTTTVHNKDDTYEESYLVSISGKTYIFHHIPANLASTTLHLHKERREISCLYDLQKCQPCHHKSSYVHSLPSHSPLSVTPGAPIDSPGIVRAKNRHCEKKIHHIPWIHMDPYGTLSLNDIFGMALAIQNFVGQLGMLKIRSCQVLKVWYLTQNQQILWAHQWNQQSDDMPQTTRTHLICSIWNNVSDLDMPQNC